jgi:predicted DNA-binding protein (UPF0251 family)
MKNYSEWARLVHSTFNAIEDFAIDSVAALGPWLTPIPSATLVARAVVIHLGWSDLLGVVTAIIIESLGLTTVSTTLQLRQFNNSKRKSDPEAPFGLAASLVSIYFFSTIGLTIMLDIYPALSRYAPGIFPILALTGAFILAIRSDHKLRVLSIEQEKQERKNKRKPKTVHKNVNNLSNNELFDTNLDRLQQGRKQKRDERLEALLTVLKNHPGISITEASNRIDVSRQTVYSYIDQLERAGQICRDGKTIQVNGGSNGKEAWAR